MEGYIKIRGARVHNLKNINVDIPKNKLVVITGLSGSGKSSLAFDTLYAEGQRRYVESLSAYARQFLGVMDKPDVDSIEGISPAIAIDQRKGAHNPRSTVGTITEIYDYLRLLFSRIGIPHCPQCGRVVKRQSPSQIADQVARLAPGSEVMVLGPVIRARKGEHRGILEEIQKGGFVRVRVDGIVHRIEEALQKELDRKKKHSIEVVVDRLVAGNDLDRPRLVDSLETALKLGKGIAIINSKAEDLVFSEHFACEHCHISLPDIEPRLFSFNSPFGACPACQGLGQKLEVSPVLVIPNPRLSLGEGAISPWAHASHKIGRQGFFWWKLEEAAKKYGFSLDDPVRDLPKKVIDLVLYGEPALSGVEGFEGVIPWLERRYHETDSDWAREEIEQYMIEKICEKCQGKRLKPEVLAVLVGDKSIDDIVNMQVNSAQKFFTKLKLSGHAPLEVSPALARPKGLRGGLPLTGHEKKIAQPIVKEIVNRLQFLIDVGLEYLTLGRKAETLSGGEEQRIRLATQIGSKLTGVLYILDEPSVGLHARDQYRLIATLKELRSLGNTIVVVEHDPQTILSADWVIDIGPGAGKQGGKVIFQGTPKALLKSATLTGEYLAGKRKVEVQQRRDCPSSRGGTVPPTAKWLVIKGAKEHNLKDIDVKIPLERLVCVTGVSGSGKSSLANDILAKALLRHFFRAKEEPGKHEKIEGLGFLNKAVVVDQSPIGRTPRSNPATYTGAFSSIRDLFSATREAKIRGYAPGRFSFNVKGGRCETCEGQGLKKIEMYFLPDVYVECEECHGARYMKEVLEVEYKAKNISDVLNCSVEEALEFFKNIPALVAKLQTLRDVGLGYMQLGQSAPSLSGGEAQRVKLATELSKKSTGKTLYILDEPTTGLHFEDIKKLLYVLRELVKKGNTVIIIEHNLDVVRNSDWVIDLGPEGGEKGGEIVAEGTPKDIAKVKKSYTGQYLKQTP